MRKMPKQPSQRLLAFLQADRQWPRHHRIAHARAMLAAGKADGRKDQIEFWSDVLQANGALANADKIQASDRWAMGDHDWHTGPKPKETYARYLHREGYIQ